MSVFSHILAADSAVRSVVKLAEITYHCAHHNSAVLADMT